MNPQGLQDLEPLGNHKHPCASRAGVYIGFCGALNPVDPRIHRITYIYPTFKGIGLQGFPHCRGKWTF